MLKKKKVNINEAIGQEQIHSFEGADRKEKVFNQLDNLAKLVEGKNKGGRPIAGESKATEKVAFHIPKQVKDWLETLTNTKERTPNAVIKKILMQQYELNKKG